MTDGQITGSMLRDFVQCERRVFHDLHTDRTSRDTVTDFIQMLWSNGNLHERAILANLSGTIADLRDDDISLRTSATRRALLSDAQFILGARLEVGDRVGMPDVIERIEGGWVAGDVKSGVATDKSGRPRLEYAIQVGHYASLLAATGFGQGTLAFVIGRNGRPEFYDLVAPFDRQRRSLQTLTAEITAQVRLIRDRSSSPRGAISAGCKLCQWHTLCEAELQMADDPTLIAGIGRALRDSLSMHAPTGAALAHLDLAPLMRSGNRTVIRGLGRERLERFQNRARLLRTPGATAYALRPLGLTGGHREIHFDIETDPLRDNLVYLHGFLVRSPVGGEYRDEYHHILAESEDQEGQAFAAAVAFLSTDSSAHIYYYSKYERSLFRTLESKYPSVCSRERIEEIFNPARATDLLFDVIVPHTEWPTQNLSIKTLARSLGFDWRDLDAGGAASIAWFNDYLETGDVIIKNRILSYNEDDVRASAVVLDGLRALPVKGAPAWPPLSLDG